MRADPPSASARRALLCHPSHQLRTGKFGPVGRGPLKESVYQDKWGQPYQAV